MSRNRPLIAAVLASLVLAAQAAPANPPSTGVEQALVTQGRFWQTRNEIRATEVWDKLLLIDPKQEEALSSLGRLAVEGKRMASANDYLLKLKKLNPNSHQALMLDQEIAFSTDKAKADLDEAHLLLREQKYDEAIAKYRALFNNRVPQGKMAVEFYSVLGYSNDGWQEAIVGLSRLRDADPSDAGIQLALANLQIIKVETRETGLRKLAQLSRRADIGGDAAEHLRSALGWMGAPPPRSMVPFFEEYLRANPDDTEIRAQLNAKPVPGGGGAMSGRPGPRQIDIVTPHIVAGYAALKAGDLSKAETEFRLVLKLRARNASATGGLGLVRLRQKNFAEARGLLIEASRLGDAAPWSEALASAIYWDLVGQAETARTRGRLEDARVLLEKAAQTNPKELTGANALAAVYGELGRPADAERAYRNVLSRAPDNIDALKGLVATLGKAGRTAEALALIEGLTPEQQARIDVRSLRATVAMAEYRDALARNDLPVARARLEDAVGLLPDDPWVRLDLARLLIGQDPSNVEARSMLRDLLARRPNDPTVLYANALLQAEIQEWPAVLELLGRVPAADRSDAMASLQRRADLQVQLAGAHELLANGRKREAIELLDRTTAGLDQDPDGLSLVAKAYVEAGANARALELLRGALVRGKATTALRLAYADVLLRTGQESELAGVLRELRGETFDSGEKIQFASLERGFALRRAEALRQQGELAAGYELMRPWLAAAPEDPALLGLLARMYADAGDSAEAMRIYRQLLTAMPDDRSALLSAGILATRERSYRDAEKLLIHARQVAPNDPDVLASLGRLYRVQGRNDEALSLLKAALFTLAPELAPQPLRLASPPSTMRSRPAFSSPDNPFADITRASRGPTGMPASSSHVQDPRMRRNAW